MAVQIPIEFLAKFEKSQAELNKFSQETSKAVSGLESKFSNLGKIVGVVFGAAIVKKGFDTALEGLAAVTKAGAEYETEVTRLGQSLRITNEFSEDAVASFLALGDEMQRNTKFTGGQIANQVALAKTYGLTNRETEKLIRASVDLAAATGDDLSTATEKLARTYSGQAGQLGKLVPQLQTLTEEQLLNGKAIDIVAKQYADFARGELSTFAGLQEKIAQNQEEVLEAFGRPITENGAVKGLLTEINNLLVNLTDYITENRDSISEFTTTAVNGFLTFLKVGNEVFRVFEMGFRTIALAGQAVLDIFQATAGVGFALRKALKGDLSGALEEITGQFKETKEAAQGLSDTSTRYDNLSASIDKIQERIVDVAANTKKVTEAAKDSAKGFDDAAKAGARFGRSLKADFEAVLSRIEQNVGDPIENLTAKLNADIKIINNAIKAGVTDEIKGAEYIKRLRLNTEKLISEERKKQIDAEEKRFERLKSRIREIINDPIRGALGENQRGNSLGLSAGQQIGVAGGIGSVNAILGGKEGARRLLGSAASAAGTALLGPAGEALGPLVQALSQGPDAVRQMVRDFAQAIPDLIEAIIDAIPVLIIELADQFPVIIERLADKAPEIIERLVEKAPDIIVALVKSSPMITLALVKGAAKFVAETVRGAGRFVQEILKGAGRFVEEIVRGAGRFIEEVIKGAGNVGKDLFGGVGDIGKSIGLGGGKDAIGGGIGNLLGGGLFGGGGGNPLGDIGRSVLNPGNWFKGSAAQSYVGSPTAPAMSGGGGRPAQIVLQVGRKQLAEVMLDINRLGYRTS